MNAMTFSQLLDILVGRWRQIAGTASAIAVLVIVVSLVVPKSYTATAALLVDVRGMSPVGASTQPLGQFESQQAMTTQTDVVMSDRVARNVVNALRLQDEATWKRYDLPGTSYHDEWLKDGSGRGDEATHIGRLVLKAVDVRFAHDSNVLNISFTSRNPAYATLVANAFAHASIDAGLQAKVAPARQFTQWFDDRTRILRQHLEEAQQRLGAYERENGLVVPTQGQLDTENARLQQLTEQLSTAQAAAADSHARDSQAASNAKASPDVVGSDSVRSSRTALTDAQAALRQLEAQLGDRHPQVVAQREQVEARKADLDREMQTMAQSVRGTDSVSNARLRTLADAVAAQKAKVLGMVAAGDKAVVLRGEVDSAQRALDAASTRQSETALESQMQQTNVSMLSEATEPTKPTSPRLLINTALGCVLGLMAGVGLALWRESRSPLVRQAAELEQLLQLPILALVDHAKFEAGRTLRHFFVRKPLASPQ